MKLLRTTLYQWIRVRWPGKLGAPPVAVALILSAAIGIIVAASATYGRYTSRFVCRECGASARETQWQIPLTSLALHRKMTVELTPLSQLLQSLDRIPSHHRHRWWLISGSGNGIMCAVGSGYNTWQAARSRQVANLVEVAHVAGDLQFADRMIQRVFQEDSASAVWNLGMEVSFDGLPDASSFADWRRNNAERIETSLNLDP